eukprot:scaffold70203_cov31-Tisochrysis_lutea.AAC.2
MKVEESGPLLVEPCGKGGRKTLCDVDDTASKAGATDGSHSGCSVSCILRRSSIQSGLLASCDSVEPHGGASAAL